MVLCMDCNHDCINFFKRCMDVYQVRKEERLWQSDIPQSKRNTSF